MLFRSNGSTWSKPSLLHPEDGSAVYCTELSVMGDEVTAYLSLHNGYFLDWRCVMMKSYDSGHTWKNAGTPPHFPEYTFIRGTIFTQSGRILIPYQHYETTREEHDRVMKLACPTVLAEKIEFCETGVLISEDGGKSFSRHIAAKLPMTSEWAWGEPTIAELGDGKIVMLMRKDGEGVLQRTDSCDGGYTWSPFYATDIINPDNKPRLISLPSGKVALLHTPCKHGARYPYELWISSDGLESWESKTRLTDFPGSYNYSDGFYENGHLHVVIEHNRHTVLYFDIELTV